MVACLEEGKRGKEQVVEEKKDNERN